MIAIFLQYDVLYYGRKVPIFRTNFHLHLQVEQLVIIPYLHTVHYMNS
jgi:hypothetical protein